MERKAWSGTCGPSGGAEHFLEHAANAGFAVKDITFSPIRGPEGNIEYLGYLYAGEGPDCEVDLKALVDASHQQLKGGEE